MPSTQLHWIWLSFLIVVLDQSTKWIANVTLPFHQAVNVMPYFEWYLTYNRGAAFSFLADSGGWQRWFFTATSLLISLVLLVWLKRLASNDHLTGIALSLILGGAIGNLIDRVYFGYVIDYIQLWIGPYPWPAFNVADAAISIGGAILILSSFVTTRPDPQRGS